MAFKLPISSTSNITFFFFRNKLFDFEIYPYIYIYIYIHIIYTHFWAFNSVSKVDLIWMFYTSKWLLYYLYIIKLLYLINWIAYVLCNVCSPQNSYIYEYIYIYYLMRVSYWSCKRYDLVGNCSGCIQIF